MVYKSGHCCCCVKVGTGTIILGVLSTLGLIQEFSDFIPARAVINLAIAFAFIFMVIGDSEARRKIFFFIYIVGSFCMYCFSIQRAYENVSKVRPWKTACEDLNRKGELDNIGAHNMSECHNIMHSAINTSLTIIFLLAFMLQLHFFSVVFTHWKNH